MCLACVLRRSPSCELKKTFARRNAFGRARPCRFGAASPDCLTSDLVQSDQNTVRKQDRCAVVGSTAGRLVVWPRWTATAILRLALLLWLGSCFLVTGGEALPELSISSVSLPEGDSGTIVFAFTVSLSQAGVDEIQVDYATSDGTALAGNDYSETRGTLTFAPGEISKSVGVTVNGDTLHEVEETFLLTLSNPVNAALGTPSQGTGTISNDDAAPTLTINDAAVTEGNSRTVNAVFNVTLSPASGQEVTVDYATADATATGSDYVAGSGKLTFAAGQTSQTITVAVIGDTLNEADESFHVTLSNPVNAVLGTVFQGTGSISNDDAAPILTINDAAVAEGNSGTVNAVFVVTLNPASGQEVTVDYATADGTATGSDYVAASGELTFAAGQTSQTITVAVIGDTLNEADESLHVTLSNPVNAVLGTVFQGTGTISNDDAAPILTINGATVPEGKSGTVNAVFVVTLSPASGQEVTVDYATADGTATGVTYVAGSGKLTFAAGQTSQTISIPVKGDTLNEADESFAVTLSNPVNATLGTPSQVAGVIQNDDILPTVSVADTTVAEGDFGSTTAVLNVILSSASGRPVSVDYITATETAQAGSDYVPTSGTVHFDPGSILQTINVDVLGDTTPEPNETFTVRLSNPVNAAIQRSQAKATIIDNEARTGTYTSAPIDLPAFGPAFTYPSTVNASGFPGTVIGVSVTLNNVSHTFPSDLDVLLVGPGGGEGHSDVGCWRRRRHAPPGCDLHAYGCRCLAAAARPNYVRRLSAQRLSARG